MVAASELASSQGTLKLERKRNRITVCVGETRSQELAESQGGRGRRGAGKRHGRQRTGREEQRENREEDAEAGRKGKVCL